MVETINRNCKRQLFSFKSADIPLIGKGGRKLGQANHKSQILLEEKSPEPTGTKAKKLRVHKKNCALYGACFLLCENLGTVSCFVAKLRKEHTQTPAQM